MTEKKSKRGGARVGSGRKKKSEDEVLIQATLRHTKSGWARFEELGGVAWFRKTVDKAHAAKVKKEIRRLSCDV